MVNSPDGLIIWVTSNPEVDILAPSEGPLNFGKYYNLGIIEYGAGGTSTAAPYVTGAAALMIAVNDCITANEVDTILKLRSKDVEHMPLNQNFKGQIGAGLLDVGQSVAFTYEMSKVNGMAEIRNHIFDRFDFSLNRIQNKLIIENVKSLDNCRTDFVSRNQITLLPNTTIKPNNKGSSHLSINANMASNCLIPGSSKGNALQKKSSNKTAKLFPNPSNGIFKLNEISKPSFQAENIKMTIYDLNGRILQEIEIKSEDFNSVDVNVQNIISGIYILKLSSNSHIEEFKFIKN